MLDHYWKIAQASLEPFQGALEDIFRTLGFFVAGSGVVPSKQVFPVLESHESSYESRQKTLKNLVPWWTSKELVAMNVAMNVHPLTSPILLDFDPCPSPYQTHRSHRKDSASPRAAICLKTMPVLPALSLPPGRVPMPASLVPKPRWPWTSKVRSPLAGSSDIDGRWGDVVGYDM